MFTEALRLASLYSLVLLSLSPPLFCWTPWVYMDMYTLLQKRAHPRFLDTVAPDKKLVRHPRSCSVCLFATEHLPCAFLSTRLTPKKGQLAFVTRSHISTPREYHKPAPHPFLQATLLQFLPNRVSLTEFNPSHLIVPVYIHLVRRSFGAFPKNAHIKISL